ncbi:conserved hypothetical protein [Dehalogenimonas lykanthroporepellens BL-DC-9]|nr:conserved hypothetical protein [Dehalogenimonas lykanthroporepellens BL-DC-9]
MKSIEARKIVWLLEQPSAMDVRTAGELKKTGWDVHMVGHRVKDKGSLQAPEVARHTLPLGVRYPLTYGAFLTAAPLLLWLRPQIIHAHGLSSHGILTAVYRRFLRFRPTVLSVTGPDVTRDAAGGMIRWSAEHALRMFEVIITPDDKFTLDALNRLEPLQDRIIIRDTDGYNDAVARAAELAAVYEKLLRHEH